MPEQDFLAWGTGPGANVETQGNYADPGVNPDLASGYPAGAIPPSPRFNKTLRQVSFVSSAIAQWMADKTGDDVLDNGVIADFVATFEAALGEQDQADIQAQAGNYAVDSSGAVNTVTVALDPVVVAPITGLVVRVQIANTNNGPTNLNYGGGNRAVRYRGAALAGGELVAGQIAYFVDDGANAILINSAVTKLGSTNVTGTSGTGNTAALTAGPTFTGTVNGANAAMSGSVSAATLSSTGSTTVGNALTVTVGGAVVSAGGIDVGNGSGTGVRIGISGGNQVVAGGFISSLVLGGAGVGTFGIGSNEIFPLTDNTQSVGDITHRWTTVFATTGTINTSDKTLKQQVKKAALNTALVNVGKRLAPLLVTYKWNDAVAKKGEKARTHIGVLAQDVVEAFTSEGLDALEWGAVCRDELTEPYFEPVEERIPVQKMEDVPTTQIQFFGEGKNRVAKEVKVSVPTPVYRNVPLMGADGVQVTDDRKEPVFIKEPVMEDHVVVHQVEKWRGTGKYIYSVRPDQIAYLVALGYVA